MSEKRTEGMPSKMAKIQMITAVNTVSGLVCGKGERRLFHPRMSVVSSLTCSLRRGFTMAQYRSPDRAVSVNTDTPMDMSLKNSLMRHMFRSKGQLSCVYTIVATGTHTSITSRSARARDRM